MNIEETIEKIAEKIPTGWKVVLEIENGFAGVHIVLPHGTIVDMADGESDLQEQMKDAYQLAVDETASDACSSCLGDGNEQCTCQVCGERLRNGFKVCCGVWHNVKGVTHEWYRTS